MNLTSFETANARSLIRYQPSTPRTRSRSRTPRRREGPDISKDPLYQKEQQRLAERYLRQHMIHQIKKLSGVKKHSVLPDAKPLNPNMKSEDYLRPHGGPIKFEFDRRTRSGSYPGSYP